MKYPEEMYIDSQIFAIVEGQGWRSCYICLPCVENWLEESGQVEDGGVNERNSF